MPSEVSKRRIERISMEMRGWKEKERESDHEMDLSTLKKREDRLKREEKESE